MTSPGDALAQLQAKDKEIAELKAELVLMNQSREAADEAWAKELRGATLGIWKARAEKAEARVAEFQAYRRLDSLSLCPRCGRSEKVLVWCCSDCQWHFLPILGKGGGRESVTPGGDTSPSGVSPSSPRWVAPIGNPPLCPIHGLYAIATMDKGFGGIKGYWACPDCFNDALAAAPKRKEGKT